jgi:predicted neuraminidase
MRLRLAPAALWLALAASPCLAAAPTFRSEVIFAPEAKHNHSSCVVETANGDLLTVWYRGSGERNADDVAILGAWLKAGKTAWEPRFVLADTPGYPDCNPAAFAAPDGNLWVFWPTILDHHWESALLKYAVAKDDGAHDGPPAWVKEGVIHLTPVGFDREMEQAVKRLESSGELDRLPEGWDDRVREHLAVMSKRSKDLLYQRLGWMPRVHPVVLPSGRWLLPLYSDTFDGSLMAITDDRGKTWTTGGPMLGFGNIQPALVRKNDGSIIAYMRENGGRGKVRASTSKDEGKSWGPVTNTAFPNPGSSVDAVRLANGHWALIYNDTPRGRHSLAVTVSDDEGATWKWTRHVERAEPGKGSSHYPSLLQTRDGLIHATYTHNRPERQNTIKHAVFSEEWVAQGDPAAGK